MKNNRERSKIVADILIGAKNGINTSGLMSFANLSTIQLRKYTHALKKGGYLEETGENREKIFKTRKKGLDTLSYIKASEEQLKDFYKNYGSK